eukprot:g32933.t1
MPQTLQDLRFLLAEFFTASAFLLRAGGEVHLRLTDQHCTALSRLPWNWPQLGFEKRLDFQEAYEKVYRPLGYRPGVVLKRAPFSVAFASTWVFRRR